MDRPPLEVADLVRVAGSGFIERSRRWITAQHLKVLRAITRCRTAALGGHRDRCVRCGYRAHSFNSCRNRHCPKCQAHARDQWLQARRRELLPTPYVHVIFTLPRRLAPLALQNKKVVYDLLFRTCAQTLLEVARDPRHLGAEIGFFAVLHTWNQKLEHHPHLHCVVAAGGLAPDHQRWIHSPSRFFLPREVLRRVFRGKFVDALKQAFADGQLGFYGDLKLLANPKAFASFLRPLFRHHWMVYCKPPFGSPQHVLRYLGRYTHRVAISNHRLVGQQDGQVTFRWRDSAHGNQQRLMTLAVEEFLRRFLLHVLPPGFVRIRHFGFLAPRRRTVLLPLCFQFLGQPTDLPPALDQQPADEEGVLLTLPPPPSGPAPVWRPHDYLGAPHRCGDVPAFSTPVSHEARMKLLSHWQHHVRSLRPRLRVPTHWPTTPPCSAGPFPVCPRDLDSTRRTQVWPADAHSPCLSSHPRDL